MDKFDILYDMLDRIGKSQDSANETLVKIRSDLDYHIKRTNLLEEQLSVLRLNSEINWKQVGVIVAILASCSSIIYYLTRIL